MNVILNEVGKIINADCLEIMKQIPDKAIDLIVTDPPYGIDVKKLVYRDKERRKAGKWYKKVYSETMTWDRDTLPIEYFQEIIRVSKKQVIFGGNYLTDKLPKSDKWIVWDKKTEDKYTNDFSDCELAWTSEKGALKIIRYLWSGMITGDMKNKEIRQHPTQKPVPVMETIIAMFSEPNDLILDPFAGSGSTLVACKKLNRRFIGIEISPEYCKIAEQRLKQGVLNF